MDQHEQLKLQKQYEQYADTQVLELLKDGPGAFVEGAYSLLEQEARRRGIAPDDPPARHRDEEKPSPEISAEDPGQPEAFVEIVVVNSDVDRSAVERAMEEAGIPYHFMRMSMAGRELPVALMVDQGRIEDAVTALRPIPLSGSIPLW
ncbi:MAG TPA: hypothetical protein PLJ26_05165 [Candidatus Omnitrophota bacterium]|nr:hypothetical protein [Candidatus Omnitrophota bacterium]HQJ15856.1 hypothetical protein [Candidatus Omnitrophota bacterium]